MTLDKREKFESRILLICAAAAVVLCLFRVPFGVDFTDESYLVTQTHLITRGLIPWLELWEDGPIVWLLIAPLQFLHQHLSGSTEGLFLFMAYATLLFRIAMSIVAWLLLRRLHGDRLAAAFAFMILFLNSLRQMGYILLSTYLLTIAGILLYTATQQQQVSRAAWRAAAAGVVMALCAVSHPTQIVNCVFFAAVLLVLERRKWKRIPLWLIYAASGMLVAVCLVTWLQIQHQGALFEHIIQVMSSGVSKQMTATNNFWDRTLASMGRHGLLPLIPLVLCALTVLVLLYWRVSRWRGAFRRLLAGGCLTACCLVLLLSCFLWGDMRSTDKAVIVLFCSVPFFLVAMGPEKRRRALRLFCFLWCGSVVTMLVILLVTPASLGTRIYTLYPGAILALPFSDWAVRDAFPNRFSTKLLVLPVVMSILFAASALVYTYTNIYRDAPLSQLTYEVESGVYKGCRTTPERGQAVAQVEPFLRELTKEGESVLFLDLFPMGYVMSPSEPRTPSSWDPLRYRDGIQSCDRLLSYFEVYGPPDSIVYVESEAGKSLSADDPENPFYEYLYANYALTDALGEDALSVRVFRRLAEN